MSTIGSTDNILSTLTAGSVNASLQASQLRFNAVQQAIQKSYLSQVQQIQSNPNQAADDRLKAQIQTVTTNKGIFNNYVKQYGTNVALFGDLATHLADAQDAINAGDSQSFDGLIGGAQIDVDNLTVIAQNPKFQPDGVLPFKTYGLGIGTAASYDLSTDSGKAAALAAVQAAAQKVGQSVQTSIQNQTIAGHIAQVFDQQISSLNANLQQDQLDQLKKSTQQVQDLQKKSATQLHLIQLAFANSQALSQSLMSQQFASLDNKRGTIFSLFG